MLYSKADVVGKNDVFSKQFDNVTVEKRGKQYVNNSLSNAQMNEWTSEQINEYVNELIKEWMNKWMIE